jgi:hypothetical protein
MAHGNGANGANHDSVQSTALLEIPNNGSGHAVGISPEDLQKIRERINEPFDPRKIKWRVTATSMHQTKHGSRKRGLLVAYANQRAYTDRLNEVFGEWGWTRSYDVQVAQNFERRIRGNHHETAIAAKVVVVSLVTIHGLGSHTGVGEEWADDQNAATRAEAQAFKRACACFGLGRYLYDLDIVRVNLDQNNRPVGTPNLPDWALPSDARHEAERRRSQSPAPRPSPTREQMLETIGQVRQKAGQSLARFVFNKYADSAEPESMPVEMLSIVFEKFTDIGKGIDRLRQAASAIGEAQYSTICQELDFTGMSVNDIPDCDALHRLLLRVEAEAAGTNGGGRNSTKRAIGDARERLLATAREIANRAGRRLADIIAEASDGTLSLKGLRDLTDADLPLVSATTSRMAQSAA